MIWQIKVLAANSKFVQFVSFSFPTFTILMESTKSPMTTKQRPLNLYLQIRDCGSSYLCSKHAYKLSQVK